MSLDTYEIEPGAREFSGEDLPRTRRKQISFVFYSAFLYVIPICIVFKSVLISPAARYVGDNQDSSQFMWYLGWFWHAVMHGQNPFVTTMMNYPHGMNLMLNTSLIAESVLLGPVVYLVNVVFAFNLLMMIDLLAAGLFGTLILRQLGVRPWAALAGGLMIEVCPYFMGQFIDGHANLVTGGALVLVLLYLAIRAVAHPLRHPRRFGLLFGAIASMLFYTSIEVFATASMTAAILMGLFLVLDYRRTLSAIRSIPLSACLASLVIVGILVLPGFVMFFFGPYVEKIPKPFMPEGMWVTDAFNLLIPTGSELAHTNLTDMLSHHFSGNYSEKDGYLGLPLLLIAYWAVIRMWSNRMIRVFALAAVLITWMSMGAKIHVLGNHSAFQTPWAILQHVPLIQNALPSRLMFYASVCLVLVTILGLEDFLKYGFSKNRTFKALVGMALLLGAWLPTIHLPHQQIPKSSYALEQNGVLWPALKGHPVTILCNQYYEFGYYMGVLAAGDYAFPVTNVYGFPYTSDAVFGRLAKDRPNQFLSANDFKGLGTIAAENKLKRFIEVRKPQYILYLQGYDVNVPGSLHSALNTVCGQPQSRAGVLAWKVPSQVQ